MTTGNTLWTQFPGVLMQRRSTYIAKSRNHVIIYIQAEIHKATRRPGDPVYPPSGHFHVYCQFFVSQNQRLWKGNR